MAGPDLRRRTRPTTRVASRALALLLLACLLLPACATTRFHERERLTDRAARFDQDDALAYIRGKLEAAREGALGGYGAAAAGGCGCQ